jgi:hypothetical protein
MSKVSCRALLLRPLLFAAALPLTLLEIGAVPAFAGDVTVTGGYGAYGSCGNPGGAGGSASAATTTPGDTSNTATAQGGHGGEGSNQLFNCHLPPKAGGPGGPATATATTNIKTGSASATANAAGGTGGIGGRGTVVIFQHALGGAGGAATATSSAVDAGAGAVTSSATARGGDGGITAGLTFITGSGGAATAAASGQSTGGGAVEVSASASGGSGGSGAVGGGASASATGVALAGNVQANASANGGVGAFPGAASAQSEAKNSRGEALTSASAPGGGAGTSPNALTEAGVGSVSLTPATFAAGRAVSNAIVTPTGPDFGIGAMSAAYGGPGQTPTLQYTATALFDFKASTGGALDLNFFSVDVVGIGFDSLELQVAVGAGPPRTYNFYSFTSAETFLANPLTLGAITAGSSESIKLTYDLTFNAGTLANVGDGFGFSYDLKDPPLGIPEPSSWALMLIGFAGLGFAGYGASRKGVTDAV